jgi:hypothetical protein
MYVTKLNDHEGRSVAVIGKFDRLVEDMLILKCGDNEVHVQHNGLEPYRTPFVRVSGVVENGILVEEAVHPISDEFDYDLYSRFVALSMSYPSIF